MVVAADQPTSFPRGKRKQSSSTTSTPSSSASTSKKPKSDAKSSTSKSTTTAASSTQDKDFLFGSTTTLDDALKKKSRSSKHHHDELDDPDSYLDHHQPTAAITSQLPLGGGAVLPPTSTSNGKRIPAKIEALSFAKFAKGTKVLGVVREVTEEYAVVSLPTMLTGFVRRGADVVSGGQHGGGGAGGEIGAPLTKVLPPINSIMSFYVLSTTTEHVSKRAQKKAGAGSTATATIKKRRIELSPWPVHVNSGVRLEEYLTSSPSPSSSTASASGGAGNNPMVVRGKITSVEDHGCLIDLGGIQNVGGVVRQAFLKFDNVEGDYAVDDEDSGSDSDDSEEEDEEKEKLQPMDTEGEDSTSNKNSKSLPKKRILNTHRIYDFLLLPSNIITPASSSNSSLPTILQLSLPQPSTLQTLLTPPTSLSTLSSLQPGQLTRVAVEAYAKNGLCVSFHNGVYRGSLDEDHLGGHRGVDTSGGKVKKVDGKEGGDASMWWKGVFRGKHAKFTARILAVDAATKIVRFSLNPHILALDGTLASFPHSVGSVIKNAQVIRVDPGIGALLALPLSSPSSEDTSDKNESSNEIESEIVKLDKELSNNLYSNSDYKDKAKVHTAYVHISKSMDNNSKDDDKDKKKSKKGKQAKSNSNNRTPEALFARHFSINTRIKSLRILSTSNLVDNIASCATAPSIVNAHVLTHADLKPGAIYENVPVLQLLESGGALVDLGVGTKGIVPALHLFDKGSHGMGGLDGADASGYRQKIRLAKYKPGNLITVRCLTVDAAARQCVLTAKKTLVSNDIKDPIVDYASVKIGQIAAGFVSRVDDNGLTVTFYDNVHGRVSSRSLAAELGVEDVRVNYHLGDVVAARVVDCVRRRNRSRSRSAYGDEEDEDEYYYQLKLSLKTVVEDKKKVEEELTPATEESAKDGSAAVPLAAGSLLMPKRMKVLQLVNCLHRDDGVFLPGYAVVAIKSKFFTGLDSSTDAVECKLPYDQLLDSYSENEQLSKPPVELDEIAKKHLKVGKRIDAEGMVLSVPSFGGADAPLPVVSLRPSLIATMKKQNNVDDLAITCPSPKSNLFLSQYVRGYVTRIDSRYGAFVRFLDGLTGLIPKLKKGLNEKLYDTILCKVTALDVTCSPPKILLRKVTEGEVAKKQRKKSKDGKKGSAAGAGGDEIQVGQNVGKVKVVDINFARAKVVLLNSGDESKVRARIHVTMATSLASTDHKKHKLSKKEKQFKEEHKIYKSHPFYDWKVGDVLSDVTCVAVDERDGVSYIELANVVAGAAGTEMPPPRVVKDPTHLPPGTVLPAIVTSVVSSPTSPNAPSSSSHQQHHHHDGLWVQVCPGISGFVPALELSNDADVLNDLGANFRVGSRITCCVMESSSHPPNAKNRRKNRLHLRQGGDEGTEEEHHQALELSVLLVPSADGGKKDKKSSPVFKPTKPHRGDVVVGRIAKSNHIKPHHPPSLMLNLRGNVLGRCCITELADVDDWENMPLGKAAVTQTAAPVGDSKQKVGVVSSDSDANEHEEDEDMSDADNEASDEAPQINDDYPDGKYVKCRVLGSKKGMVELSLRESRLSEASDNNLEDDPVPETNEMAHAYVVATTKKGCFVRLSRCVEGRVILKELSDDFIPNPSAMFPPGRLVVGKVKNVKQASKGGNQSISMVDMDMRESVLLSGGKRLTIDDIEENSKHTGVITRVESYGVFVRIDNSDISGLAHVSECSDTYIKNIHDLYNPGDFVKIVVISMDKEQKRLGFSLKASNFVEDDDSDSDDDDGSSSSSGSKSDSDAMEEDGDGDDNSIDSEDEDFASKLAKKMDAAEGKDEMDIDDDKSTDGDDESSSSGSEGSSDSESEDDEDLEENAEGKEGEPLGAMDTNVGFDWGASKPTKTNKMADESSDDDSSSSSEDESDEDDDADSGFKTSHKSRKKAAAKRREEEETSRREAALADGTADDAPETSADFERLVASSPNSSEVWIKYMAFHLSLADIDSARNVANRAFERIEFRQEGEKLNVWTALLTLELKYGTDKSLHEAVDRACQQNNPKQVYLRVCELLDKEVDAASSTGGGSNMDLDTSTKRADEMFKKMCKKFKSKKSVWLAHFQYLLKGSRHEEAHALLKRSLQSLPTYKHVEVMSKFAQMEFELGSPERGRTIFNALLEKHPKRTDLLFVHIDKEVKNGDIAKARALFDSVVNPAISHGDSKKFKFSDKQMKSLFKKWYRMEEEHGDEESQERVKEEARAFVSKADS